MKKWVILFISIALISSLIILNLQQEEVKTTEDWETLIIKTDSKSDINLNKFIEKYNEWVFDEVELINSKELIWMIKVEEREVVQNILFWQKATEVYYEKFKTNKPEETTLSELWFDLTWKTQITVKYEEDSFFQRVFLETMLPLLIILFLIILLFRFFGPKWWWFPFWANAGKLHSKENLKAKFKDVAGMDESKAELEEIVEYLKKPTKYKNVWAKIPRWVLLYWPPGSGKTLVARAVAWEANVPFFTASWSEFMEMLVGMWAAKVRDLFKKAKEAAPAIIFIDEIDTIGKKRWQGSTGWHQEQEQTLNQILTEMDGFDKDSNVIVIAATNRPDMLDKALLRPWRFDRKVYVWTPTLEERIEILKIHTKDKKLAKDVEIESIARRTSSFVWADLENLANEAALKVAKDNRKVLTNDDFEYALEKIVMWPEKKIKTLKDKERKIITYHELWHAITAYNLPNADPVEKISIVSRWMALWVTWMLPTEDRYLYSKAKFLDELVTLLWGRAAEEIVFWVDEITTWASNDFEKVTKIATEMITKYWMDPEVGTISYSSKEEKEYQMFRPYSELTTQEIDKKVQNIVKNAYEKSIKLIKENREIMEILANILLEKEYLTKEEFESLMKDPSKAEEVMNNFEKKKKNKASQEEKSEEKDKDEDIKKDDNENETIQEDSNNKNDKDDKATQKERLKKMLDKFLR